MEDHIKKQLGSLLRSLLLNLLLFYSLCFTVSCLPESGSGGSRQRQDAIYSANKKGEKTPEDSNGRNSHGGVGANHQGSNVQYLSSISELRHFADPHSGSYRTKITLSKNYSGFLYLAGINLPSLTDKIVSVRFRFGQGMEPVDIPATITRAEGIIPQTDLLVLALDMRDKPFQHIRLLYDLYDYNIYGLDDDPVQDPKNQKLFCRGLRLEHDPTFESSVNNVACDTVGEKCFYSFAKIKDSGLYSSAGIAKIPTEPLIDLSGSDFSTTGTLGNVISARTSQNLKKCLPDSGRIYYQELNNYKQMTYVENAAHVAALGDNILTVGTGTNKTDYSYKGPYRVLSKNSWAMQEAAAIDPLGANPNGLFGSSLNGTVETGIFSYLFPRGGKMNLKNNIQYLGATKAIFTDPITDNRKIQTLVSSGKTLWMDGCNLRVSQFNDFSGEGIGSCNVTATVEVITINSESQNEEVLISSTDLKLQLIRRSETDDFERETLYESMKVCSSGRSCGKDECCFNERCWSKDLVSQCIEDATTEGNFQIGENCSSDYQCSSLCCNRSTGRCAVHNSYLDPPVYCSKSPGDQCVTKDWCRKDVVRDCRIIKTGVTPQGAATCALQCYNRLTHGDCSNGVCVAPKNLNVPFFDPSNPDCSNAVDPPTSFD